MIFLDIFLIFDNHMTIRDFQNKVQELFTQLRPLIYAHRVPGRFILLGSASPSLGERSFMEVEYAG